MISDITLELHVAEGKAYIWKTWTIYNQVCSKIIILKFTHTKKIYLQIKTVILDQTQTLYNMNIILLYSKMQN